jgi:hypothetical protein
VSALISAEEITHYTSDRFLTEPQLWRVQVRSLRLLGDATRSAQEGGDAATKANEWALRAFLGGLGFSLLAIATLLVESA